MTTHRVGAWVTLVDTRDPWYGCALQVTWASRRFVSVRGARRQAPEHRGQARPLELGGIPHECLRPLTPEELARYQLASLGAEDAL